jgi:hypothetical protein
MFPIVGQKVNPYTRENTAITTNEDVEVEEEEINNLLLLLACPQGKINRQL